MGLDNRYLSLKECRSSEATEFITVFPELVWEVLFQTSTKLNPPYFSYFFPPFHQNTHIVCLSLVRVPWGGKEEGLEKCVLGNLLACSYFSSFTEKIILWSSENICFY